MSADFPLNSAAVFSRADLKAGAMALLSPGFDFAAITAAISGYRRLLYSVSEMATDFESGRKHLFFENGKAIGPFWAAKCLDEPLRTKCFATGLYKAILDLRRKNPERPVQVMYAGTGPFATLMLPVAAMLEPSEVQFTLLEINSLTFSHLQKVIDGLQLRDYIASMEIADASSYRIAPGHLPDIIVSETMQHALTREMQVPLMFNLASQAREAILIPQEIQLSLGWWNPGIAGVDQYPPRKDSFFPGNLGVFFRLDRELIDLHSSSFFMGTKPVSFPAQFYELKPRNDSDELTIFTSIRVYEDEFLGLNQCSLTIPYKVSRLFRGIPRCGRVNVFYQVSAVPGPQIEVLEPQEVLK